MFKKKDQLNPIIFTSKFQSIAYQYLALVLKNNFCETIGKQEVFKSVISSQVPGLWNWNRIPAVTIKSLCTLILFKKHVQKVLVNLEN